MGYNTNYSLSTNHESVDEFEEVVRVLREALEDAKFAFNENGNTESCCKWYEHEEDMIIFSKQFPDTIFTLYGTGDEAYDIWKKYFKNGQMQIAPANIHFDECEL